MDAQLWEVIFFSKWAKFKEKQKLASKCLKDICKLQVENSNFTEEKLNRHHHSQVITVRHSSSHTLAKIHQEHVTSIDFLTKLQRTH